MLTYRQLHAKKIGPQHPLRVIAHCDVDAAYAQFEQVRLKIPPEKPLAVQQWRGLIAVNYPARKFGITRHLPFDQARKLCPELICVHVATYAHGDSETEAKYHENPRAETHKVSLDPYRRESVKILKIFSESCPTIEKASIDEAFLDFSIPVREILCTRYAFPSLEALQDSSSEISLDDPLPNPPPLDLEDLLRSSQSNLVPLDADSDHHTNTWTDVALLIGAELMARCRQQVFDRLGYTCSAGIATNKMLAKLCSAYKKPNAQTVLRAGAVRDFLRPFELSKLRFLGGKLGQSVSELVDSTCDKSCQLSEVWKIPLSQLQASLGEQTGMWVWETVRGVDRSEVETKTLVKSMMSSKNFRPSITTWSQALHWLRILARDLCARLNEAREATPGIWPKLIVMHKRDGLQNSLTKQIAFPFTAQLTDDYIFSLGKKLLQEFAVIQTDQTYRLDTVTSLALAFHNLERIEAGQRAIQGFFAPQSIQPRSRSNLIPPTASSSTDTSRPTTEQLNSASPSRSVSSLPQSAIGARGLRANKKPKRGTLDGFLDPSSSTTISAPKAAQEELPGPTASGQSALLKYVCPRCKAVVAVDDGLDQEERQIRFERLKNVHLDHHFAVDLWDHDRGALPSTGASNAASNHHQPSGAGNRTINEFFKPVPPTPTPTPKTTNPRKRKS
ncbi:DNA-directed DNA polymerase eta rad30 [Puccinia graminis f. sp. tritici]|uniref:DNA polymerase eta n=1 Tax=Puccinia graminis f. sp. tritici TaxID=56615 RepID=A0A5B0RUA0_PUCGR|nr:DNA-directed DNA polymerase eta rad30 [Puccinia graminis f. sp. tritici]